MHPLSVSRGRVLKTHVRILLARVLEPSLVPGKTRVARHKAFPATQAFGACFHVGQGRQEPGPAGPQGESSRLAAGTGTALWVPVPRTSECPLQCQPWTTFSVQSILRWVTMPASHQASDGQGSVVTGRGRPGKGRAERKVQPGSHGQSWSRPLSGDSVPGAGTWLQFPGSAGFAADKGVCAVCRRGPWG